MYQQPTVQPRLFSIPLISILAATFLLTGVNVGAQVLEEIIVTAQKREQNIQDVAISITALSGEQMRALGYTTATEVPNMAPGVILVQPNSRGSYGVSMRGVIQTNFSDHQEHPVSLYVDEAYISQGSGAGFQLFDLERVEILRGPQGTLYGRNATGGAMSFITKKPSQEFDAFFSTKYGSFNNTGFEGAIGGGISENTSARLSAQGNWHDGYAKNRIGTDQYNDNSFAVRGQMLIDFNDDVSLTLNGRGAVSEVIDGVADTLPGDYRDSDEAGFIRGKDTITTHPLAGSPGIPGSTDCLGCDYFGYVEPDEDPYTNSHNTIGWSDMHTWGAGARLEWETDSFDIVSITDWYQIDKDYYEDSDNTPILALNTFIANEAEQFSQEIRISGESERMRWVGGFYYLNIDGDYGSGFTVDSTQEILEGGNIPADGLIDSAEHLFPFIPCFGGANTQFTDTCGLQPTSHGQGTFAIQSTWNLKTESYSFFGETELDLSDSLTLTGGIRLIQEEKVIDFKNTWALFNRDVGVDFLGDANVGQVRYVFGEDTAAGSLAKYDELLWAGKIGLDWQVNDDLMTYFTINRGVKGGGFNAPDEPEAVLPEDIPFKAEVLIAYEVGFKASVLDGRMRLNGSAFYYDYSDFQAFIFKNFSNKVSNEDAEVKGWELELQGSLFTGMDVMFGVGFLDGHAKGLDFGAGPENRTLPKLSEWSVNGMARYEWPNVYFANSSLAGRLAVQGDFNYRSEFNFLITAAPAGIQEGYVIGNASLNYATENGNWEGSLAVKNIADQYVTTQVFDVATFFGSIQRFFDRPRWVSGHLRYNF